MMHLAEYAQHDATALAHLVKTGALSAAELAATASRAIERLNPRLNAVVTRNETANAQALPTGPLAGVPSLLKDGCGLAGQRAVMGALAAKSVICAQDSELTRRLKHAGVVLLGSTNAAELGNSCTTENLLDGPARNPWDPSRSTGGSSGGAAVAVAAGLVPVAHATDGGGSIRTPAHCCGVFGLKPSRGRNPVGPASFGGLFGGSVPHVLSRTVRDSAAFLDILSGDEPGALYRCPAPPRPFASALAAAPGPLRIAYAGHSPSDFPTGSDCRAAVVEAAELCASLGHHVEEAGPRYDWPVFSRAFLDVWVSGLPWAMTRLEAVLERHLQRSDLEPGNWANLSHARTLTLQVLHESMQTLFAIARGVQSFFDDYDLLLTPVNLEAAAPLGVRDASMPFDGALDYFDRVCSEVGPFLPIFNVTGQPAMSVPFAQSDAGLPIGVQFAGRFGREDQLLQLAAQIEAARPWAHRIPPIHAGRQENA